MNDLFMALALLSFAGIIIGLIKPSLIKFKSRKQALYIFGGSAVLFFILFGVTSGPTPASAPTPVAQVPQVKSPETQTAQQPAPKPKTLEEKITDAVNASLGSQTNMGKPRVAGVEVDKYNAQMLSGYGYKKGNSIVGLLITINADENLTVNLMKGSMHNEAAKIAQAVFPLDQSIGDIIIWSQLPVKDQYGKTKDDTAIVYSIARPLFAKINWSNFDYHNLPALLKSEHVIDDRNNYYENIKF
jgi:hypothetical protein